MDIAGHQAGALTLARPRTVGHIDCAVASQPGHYAIPASGPGVCASASGVEELPSPGKRPREKITDQLATWQGQELTWPSLAGRYAMRWPPAGSGFHSENSL